MTIQRLENVGIVVDDLAAATEFFVALRQWADSVLCGRGGAAIHGDVQPADGGVVEHRSPRARPSHGRCGHGVSTAQTCLPSAVTYQPWSAASSAMR